MFVKAIARSCDVLFVFTCALLVALSSFAQSPSEAQLTIDTTQIVSPVSPHSLRAHD